MKLKNRISNSILLPCLTLVLACSCENQNANIGNDLVSPTLKVYQTDTLSVTSSTIQFDSLNVSTYLGLEPSNPNPLLIGVYSATSKTKFNTTSKSYIQFYSNNYASINNNDTYKSIALILKRNTYVCGNCTENPSFNVYKVTEAITPKNEQQLFYNNTSFSYNNESLVNTQKKSSSNFKGDSLQINLTDEFGKSIFGYLKDTIQNNDQFLKKYPGLLVEVNNKNACILGFTPNSVLRLTYTQNSEEKQLDMPLDPSHSFNSLTSNNVDKNIFNDNKKSYTQAGTGIAIKIEIPNLDKATREPSKESAIVNANLKISLISEENDSPPDSLIAFICEKKMPIALLRLSQDSNSPIAYGIKIPSSGGSGVVTYSMPIQSFLKTKQSESDANDYYLAIMPRNYNTSVDSYTFYGSGENTKDLKPKLELTYALYD